VHRIGRTARMAASGRASSFAAPEEHDLLRGIEKLTRKSVERAAVPRESEAFKAEVTRKVEAPRHRPHRAQAPRQQRAGHAPRHQHPGPGSGAPKSIGTWKPRRRR